MIIKFVVLKVVAFLLLFTTPATECASTSAREFIIGFPKSSFRDEVLRIFLTTPHEEGVQVSISSLTGYSLITTVSAGRTSEIVLPSSFEVIGGNDYNKGILIRSLNADRTISVSVMRHSITSTLSGAYLAIPPVAYPGLQEYVYSITSYFWANRTPRRFNSTALLVGSSANTVVVITPSQTIEIPQHFQSNNYPRNSVNAGDSYTVSLQKMETLQIESAFDLTGTIIRSNKPLTVLGSHECVDIPEGMGYCDLIIEQVPPSATWGRTFLFASLHSRLTGERYRVVGLKPSTTVRIKCVSTTNVVEPGYFTLFLNISGEVREFTLGRDRLCSIVANKPVLLIQYSLGYSLDNVGDPFMLVIPPVEQYSNNYTVQAPLSYNNHLTISVPLLSFSRRKIFLNDTTLNGWSPVYCSDTVLCGYVVRLAVPPGTHRVRHADSEGRLSVFVYGFEYHDGYGLMAGMELNWIADVCEHGELRLDPLNQVETCQDGVWTNVDGEDNWTLKESSVACKQMGYSQYGSNAYPAARLDRSLFPPISNVRCTGSELKLTGCVYDWNVAGGVISNQSMHLRCHPYYNISIELFSASHSPHYTLNPATFTCKAIINASSTSTGVTMEISWMREGGNIPNNTDYLITGVEHTDDLDTQMQFESNLTVRFLSERDNGTYLCTATAVSSMTGQPLTDMAVTSMSVDIIESESLIFQIILIGVGHCSDWLLQHQSPQEKVSQVKHSLLEMFCLYNCPGPNSNHISDGSLRCFHQSSDRITFRARLHAASQPDLTNLVRLLVDWVNEASTLSVSGVLLSVDTECEVVIDSFGSGECEGVVTSTTTTSATSSTTTTITTTTTPENDDHVTPCSTGIDVTTGTKHTPQTTTIPIVTSTTLDSESSPSVPSAGSSGGLGGGSLSSTTMYVIIGSVAMLLALFLLLAACVIVVISCLKYNKRPSSNVLSVTTPFPLDVSSTYDDPVLDNLQRTTNFTQKKELYSREPTKDFEPKELQKDFNPSRELIKDFEPKECMKDFDPNELEKKYP